MSDAAISGLFALWALYRTDFFAGAVSASGSVWFPGFREFVLGGASRHVLSHCNIPVLLSH